MMGVEKQISPVVETYGESGRTEQTSRVLRGGFLDFLRRLPQSRRLAAFQPRMMLTTLDALSFL